MPGELYPELSVGGVERYAGADFPDAPVEPAVKQQMTAPFRMLFGLADDEVGYIIPKAEWDEKPPFLQNAAKALVRGSELARSGGGAEDHEGAAGA